MTRTLRNAACPSTFAISATSSPCESGRITGAARSLHLAQPALTQALQALEREVGVPLLDRHPKGVTPTAAGTASTEMRGRRSPRSS